MNARLFGLLYGDAAICPPSSSPDLAPCESKPFHFVSGHRWKYLERSNLSSYFATDRFVSNITKFGTCWNHLGGNILTLYKHQLPQAPLYQSNSMLRSDSHDIGLENSALSTIIVPQPVARTRNPARAPFRDPCNARVQDPK